MAEKKQRLHNFLLDTAKKSSFEWHIYKIFLKLGLWSMLSPWVKVLAPQHAVSLCKIVGSPVRWAANEKVLPSLHAGPTVSFYYWDLIFCV